MFSAPVPCACVLRCTLRTASGRRARTIGSHPGRSAVPRPACAPVRFFDFGSPPPNSQHSVSRISSPASSRPGREAVKGARRAERDEVPARLEAPARPGAPRPHTRLGRRGARRGRGRRSRRSPRLSCRSSSAPPPSTGRWPARGCRAGPTRGRRTRSRTAGRSPPRPPRPPATRPAARAPPRDRGSGRSRPCLHDHGDAAAARLGDRVRGPGGAGAVEGEHAVGALVEHREVAHRPARRPCRAQSARYHCTSGRRARGRAARRSRSAPGRRRSAPSIPAGRVAIAARIGACSVQVREPQMSTVSGPVMRRGPRARGRRAAPLRVG